MGLLAVAAFTVLGLTGCQSIQNKSLPVMYTGYPVTVPLRASGFEGPVTWSATGLPDGIWVQADEIHGTPEEAGTFAVELTATDGTKTKIQPLTLVVEEPNALQQLTAGHQDEHPGWAMSSPPSVSDDGRYVAFRSYAPNLVEGDGNSIADLFVVDRTTGATKRLAFPWSGVSNQDVEISGNGRYVAFSSYDQLDPLARPDTYNVYVWDHIDGGVTLASSWPLVGDGSEFADGSAQSKTVISDDGRVVAWIETVWTGGEPHEWLASWEDGELSTAYLGIGNHYPAPSISDDGRYVVVHRTGVGQEGVWEWDRAADTFTRIVAGNGTSSDPAISGDGQTVAFTSHATDLVPEGGDEWYGRSYIWHRPTGVILCIGAASTGQGYGLSDDGRTVAWSHWSGGYQPLWWERDSGAVTNLYDPNAAEGLKVSGDGSVFVMQNFQPTTDIFAWER